MMHSTDIVRIAAAFAGGVEPAPEGGFTAYHPTLGFFAYCKTEDDVGSRMERLTKFYLKTLMDRGGPARLRLALDRAGVKYDISFASRGKGWSTVSEAEKVYA